ncbi:MAG: hypothetical protein ABFS46_15820 [Myxococcota bacterium]
MALLGLGSVLTLAIAAFPVAASEIPSDRDKLFAALDTLAGGPELARGSAGSDAMAVIASEECTDSDLADLLGTYFLELERPFPNLLHVWLSRATLHGSDQQVREKLQGALAPVLAARIGKLFAERGAKLGAAAAASVTLRETVVNTMQLLAEIATRGTGLSEASRREIYGSLRSEIARYPYFLRKNVTIDVQARPLLATIRAQLYQIMRDIKPLDAHSFVADTGFHGRYAEFVRRDGLLVLDNNCLDEAQLQAIEDLRDAIPASLHNETRISVHNPCLGTPRNRDGSWWMLIRGSQGVNISGLRVGAVVANQFPADSEPIEVSAFCSVLQHELNHVVNAYGIRNNPALAARQAELVERAGADSQQFLRSQIEERSDTGLFRSAPQEFFASIANQYLSNSMQTMELGFERLLQGYAEPLNQFLFFLEVYSLSGTTSLFFTQSEACRYQVETVTLERNAKGFIRRVLVDGTPYEFVLDSRGYVTW